MKAKISLRYVVILLIFTFIASPLSVSAQTQEPASIEVTPTDTVIYLGETISFIATAFDTSGTVLDTTFTWGLAPGTPGAIDSSGLYTADSPGEGYVIISLGALSDSAHVTVIDTAISETINTVTIQKVLSSGKLHPKQDVVQEGSGEYKFSGFPSPLNILNGGRLHFPVGSLSEDIFITIKLPTFANVESDSNYSFEHGDSTKIIANAAEFIVTVDGDTISPYYFDIPVSVSLPYKVDLLASMGITPDNLSIAFYGAGGEFDTTGITNAQIDTVRNRLTADIAHFTTIALFSEKDVASSIDDNGSTGKYPHGYALSQNYPNPFNPDTGISFNLPATSHVKITIYNIIGQEVRTLVNEVRNAGLNTVIWNGRDNRGMQVSSGLYIYQMKSGNMTLTKKMTLLR